MFLLDHHTLKVHKTSTFFRMPHEGVMVNNAVCVPSDAKTYANIPEDLELPKQHYQWVTAYVMTQEAEGRPCYVSHAMKMTGMPIEAVTHLLNIYRRRGPE